MSRSRWQGSANGALRCTSSTPSLQIMSAGFMAVIMHGGPALMYLSPLMEALDELTPPR
jgi:hypothetical protein